MKEMEANIHRQQNRVVGRFHINSAYDTLFGFLGSCNEVSSSNSTTDNRLDDIDSESLNTDDFSSSTSSERKIYHTPPNDQFKTPSSSNTETSSPILENECEAVSYDLELSTNDETELKLRTEAGTEKITLHEESGSSSEDRKPSSRHNVEESRESMSSITSDNHAIKAMLQKANQNHESFPYTLRRLLNVESQAGHRSIQWLKDGNGFEVIDQNVLENEVLPRYFPTSCIFQSFVRRLYR